MSYPALYVPSALPCWILALFIREYRGFIPFDLLFVLGTLPNARDPSYV